MSENELSRPILWAIDAYYAAERLGLMLYFLLAVLLTVAPLDRGWSFDEENLDKEPRGFYFDTTNNRPDGKWRVIADGERRVVAQLDQGRDNNRLALAIVEGVEVEDVRLRRRSKWSRAKWSNRGASCGADRNSENYLFARIDPEEKNVRLYRVVDGNRIRFGGEDYKKLELGGWYTLRIEHRGTRIKVYLNDEMLFDERDRHFVKPGKIGLWTKADAVVYFDDLHALELDDD